MHPKRILVHADLAFAIDDRLRLAARLARATGAHLIGVAMAGAPCALRGRGGRRDDAALALARFAAIAREAGLPTSETRLVDPGFAVLVRQARGCDLAIVGQHDLTLDGTPAAPALPCDLGLRLAEASGLPVLSVPCAGWRGADAEAIGAAAAECAHSPYAVLAACAGAGLLVLGDPAIGAPAAFLRAAARPVLITHSITH